MTTTTHLNIKDKLPLTCTRSGTCCHGKLVLLNPWELMRLAQEKKITPRQFCDQYCEYGGIRLRFNGKTGWKGLQACSQYSENYGCSVHLGRPLSCRLYPLGRQIQNEEVHYIYQGTEFPCMEGCPDVVELEHLSVEVYLKGQLTEAFEKAQDEYLEIMQNIADIAFVLLLDSGLAASGDTRTLNLWRKIGNEHPEKLANRIGQEWIDYFLFPEIDNLEDLILFTQEHNNLLQEKAQEKYGNLKTLEEFHEASVQMMGLAMYIGYSIGADTKGLSEHWITTAKNLGVIE